MEKHLKIMLFIFLLCSIAGYAQTGNEAAISAKNKNTSAQKDPATLKNLIIDNGSTSSLSRAPQGSMRYIRTCYIISASEMASAGIPKGVRFSKWGFHYNSCGYVTATGNLKIYLENTTDEKWSKNTTWSNGSTGVIDSMTMVNNSNVTLPSAAGDWDIPLSNGSGFIYTGGALYVAFEYQNPNGLLSADNIAACSSLLVGGSNGLRNTYSTASMGETLSNSSQLRPVTRAVYKLDNNNDAAVDLIYSYGQVPLSFGTPVRISALIQNLGKNTLSNLNATLSINGANTFASTKVIPVISSDSGDVMVNFDAFTPTAKGINNVTVSVDSDDNNSNNSVSSVMSTTDSSYTYCDNSDPYQGIGFSSGSGMYSVKYFINGATSIGSVTFRLFDYSANVGKSLYGTLMDSTGNIIDRTPNYTVTSADLGKDVTLFFNKKLKIEKHNILIGIAVPTSGFYPVSTQQENPLRGKTFYTSEESGYNLREIATFGRFMIGVNLPGVILPAPVAVQTQDYSVRSIYAVWYTVTGAAKYYLDVATDNQFNNYLPGYQNLEISLNSSNYSHLGNESYFYINGLTGNTTYYYRVRYSDGQNLSPNSNTIGIKTLSENLLKPLRFRAGSGFKNSIPLNWLRPEYSYKNAKKGINTDAINRVFTQNKSSVPDSDKSQVVSYYVIYRKAPGENYKLLASSKTNSYIDSLVVPGYTYYYKVSAMIDSLEGPASDEVYAACNNEGFRFNIPNGHITPTMDGKISSGEWTDAMQVNIKTNLGYFESASSTIPSKSVICYMKKLDNYLYIAIDDNNDITKSISDQVGVYFDLNKNGKFDPGEGNMWFIDTLGTIPDAEYREITGTYPDLTFSDSVQTHIDGAWGYSTLANSHRNWELKIDMTTSKLKPADGKTLRMLLFAYDDNTIKSVFDAFWPDGCVWTAPQTYADITLGDTISTTPIAYQATSVLAKSFTANWSVVSGANKYYLDVATDSLFTSCSSGYNCKEIYGTTYTVTGLTPGKLYFYRVRSCANVFISPNSNIISVTTPQTDSTLIPQNFMAFSGYKNCIPLKWDGTLNKPATSNLLTAKTSKAIVNKTGGLILPDNKPEAVNVFRIYRKPAGGEYQLIDSLTYDYFLDTLVTPGATYTYKVSAVIYGVESGFSQESSAACNTKGIVISVPSSAITPKLDGTMDNSEWADAVQFSIKNEIGIGNGAPSKDVICFMKKVNDSLFVAVRDYNDVVSNLKDKLSLYFDANDNRILDNNDGDFIILDSLKSSPSNFYEKMVEDPPYFDIVSSIYNPTGFTSASSLNKGYREWEFKIDLVNSKLYVNNGNTFGFLFIVSDAGTGIKDGFWPNVFIAPRLFAEATWSNGPVTGHSIMGNITYSNSAKTPMAGGKVYLTTNGGTIDSTITAQDGSFCFSSVQNGSYNLKLSGMPTWGGVNSTDALYLRQFVIGARMLDSLQLKASDVNLSGAINSTDALLIRQRTVGLINTFMVSDWIAENPSVIINNADYNVNIRCLCAGDLNGSYIPYLAKSHSAIALVRKGEAGINSNKQIELPVTINTPLKIGAITLMLDYCSANVDITGIKSKINGLAYTISNGKIKIAWDDTTPVAFKEGESILTLIAEPKTDVEKASDIQLTLDNESELADENGNILENISLSIPFVVANSVTEYQLMQNYPNPFNPSTTIKYALPADSFVDISVCNILGQRVKTLINEIKQKGSYELKFEAGNLPSGIYFYILTAKSLDGSKNFQQVNKLVIMK